MITATSFWGWGTGALALPFDPGDYHAHRIPGVAAALAQPLPDAADLLDYLKGSYNQGALPACAAFAPAVMKSVQDEIEHGGWNEYDALECYHACGGNDREGIDPRRALAYLRDKGLRLRGGTARYRIGSYAFVSQDARFVPTLKAAIVAKQPCVVAVRLPTQFGWDSSGDPTDAYHELTYLGFDPEWALFANTWGPRYGKNGLVRLRWSYLTDNGFQRGDCRAYTCIDAVDEGLAPHADPAPAPAPLPPAPPLAVCAYLGAGSAVPEFAAGAMVQVVGQGFDSGVLQAFFCEQACELIERQERLLKVKLPPVLAPCLGNLIVQREGVQVVGPPLAVKPVH